VPDAAYTPYDELSAPWVGSEALALSLVDPLSPKRAKVAIDISVDYTGASDEGVTLPLEQLAVGPSPDSFRRHVHRRQIPSIITFTPPQGGRHIVTLRQVGGDKLFGKLTIEVEGEPLDGNGRV
jgi:hypothetical protein